MGDKRPEVSDPEPSYFELQAYVGTTKHMGGFETTKALIELCHINEDTYVLDAGCGVGATACYLAKRYGCSVVGVDISEGMIARSHERAKRERVEDSVEFRVADVRNLPFDDALFDVVICESVATFIEDKRQVAGELVRVTKPGGYVGLNEEIWIKTPPTELVEFAKRTWEIKGQVPTADGWVGLLAGVGLRNIVVVTLLLRLFVICHSERAERVEESPPAMARVPRQRDSSTPFSRFAPFGRSE